MIPLDELPITVEEYFTKLKYLFVPNEKKELTLLCALTYLSIRLLILLPPLSAFDFVNIT